MPYLHPEDPVFASDAERVVWEALAAHLPDDAHLLADQRLTVGPQETEIDVLVLWPGVGIAVIEVKGGLVSVHDGIWRQSDRSGAHDLKRSPIDQAQAGKHQLLEWLRPRLSRPVGRAAHLAILPFTTLPADWDAPEAPRSILLDSSDMADLPARIAAALQQHAPAHLPPPDAAQARVIVTSLRRTHQALMNHRALLERIEDEANVLTHEQERVISLLRLQPRAQIIGGAGSGKTHLALIKARALARSGQRTALMCYSRGLARHFQLLTAQWPLDERPDYVGLFHDLPVTWGAESEADFPGGAVEYYEHHLPTRLSELAGERGAGDLFDAIVVDEGQDFADLWWDGLRRCLRDPDDGILYVFTDAHQSVFDRTGHAPITLSPFPLDENLRNTRTIAATFASLTPLEQTPRLGDGPPVVFVDCDAEDVIERADDVVESLLDDWEGGDIALLTTGRRHPEQRSRIEYSGYDGYWDEFFAEEDVFYGHVLNVKGLERRAVVLAVNGFQSPERAAHLLYVGLSRARSQLVVVGPREVIEAAGGPEVLEALGAG